MLGYGSDLVSLNNQLNECSDKTSLQGSWRELANYSVKLDLRTAARYVMQFLIVGIQKQS
jgi:hypothetical protein